MIGIYKILNAKNNKVYVGSSSSIKDRWRHHKNSLTRGTHHSKKLQESFNEFGIDSFVYEIIEKCDLSNLVIREQYYIDFFDSFNSGFNSIPKAESHLGMIHSEEAKELIRQASIGNTNMLGKHHTDETKKAISLKLKGKTLSESTKNKMSIAGKGRVTSNETKEKQRIAKEGKNLSKETKEKLSLSHIGKKQSEETINKRVAKNTGLKRTQEIKDKMSESMKGIKKGPMSEEQKLLRSKKLSKKISHVTESGSIIKEYNSVNLCGIEIGIDPRRISDVLRGTKKSYKGYYFRYSE